MALRRGKWNWSGLRRAINPGDLRGLPTLGAQCRFIAAFQTLRWHAAKVGS